MRWREFEKLTLQTNVLNYHVSGINIPNHNKQQDSKEGFRLKFKSIYSKSFNFL